MRTVYIRPVLDHKLMHLATEQGIPAQLVRLSEARLVRQEIHAGVPTLVLLVLPLAVVFVRLADCVC